MFPVIPKSGLLLCKDLVCHCSCCHGLLHWCHQQKPLLFWQWYHCCLCNCHHHHLIVLPFQRILSVAAVAVMAHCTGTKATTDSTAVIVLVNCSSLTKGFVCCSSCCHSLLWTNAQAIIFYSCHYHQLIAASSTKKRKKNQHIVLFNLTCCRAGG